MSQSRLSGKDDHRHPGRRPVAWDKLQLGWLDYELERARRTGHLGPHEYNSTKPQAVVVPLPKKAVVTTTDAVRRRAQWWSGMGDDLTNVDDPDGRPHRQGHGDLSPPGPLSTSSDFDYLYIQASTDGGANWTSLDGTSAASRSSVTAATSPRHLRLVRRRWLPVDVPLDAYAGQDDRAPVPLPDRRRRGAQRASSRTRSSHHRRRRPGRAERRRGRRQGLDARRLLVPTGGTERPVRPLLHRLEPQYVSYDKYLKTGPYNFGWVNTKPDWVEHFPYQQGLLVSYWDTSQLDNNTSEHPGQVLILPIDSHPVPQVNLVTGTPSVSRARWPTHRWASPDRSRSRYTGMVRQAHPAGGEAQPLFDDTRQFRYPELPNAGVDLPGAGVKMRVQTMSGTSMRCG